MLAKTRKLRTISLNSSQQWTVLSKIRRDQFSLYEFNSDNGDFLVVKTIRMFIIQIINLKCDNRIYLKISLRMRVSVAHNEIVQFFTMNFGLYFRSCEFCTYISSKIIGQCKFQNGNLQLSSPTQNSISRA